MKTAEKTSDLPTFIEIRELTKLAVNDDADLWEVGALLRQLASMRVITTSSTVWSKCLEGERVFFRRVWTWSLNKMESFREEVLRVG